MGKTRVTSDELSFFAFLNQFALMIFFDIFNKRVHKVNITILNTDHNFLVHNSYFLSAMDLCDITERVFPSPSQVRICQRKKLLS